MGLGLGELQPALQLAAGGRSRHPGRCGRRRMRKHAGCDERSRPDNTRDGMQRGHGVLRMLPWAMRTVQAIGFDPLIEAVGVPFPR